MRYAFVERHRTVWPIAAQCRALNVSASGYRQYRARQTDIGPLQPGRRLGDVALLVHIKAVFSEMKSAYGWPRIWRELQARGIRAEKERVRKLMQAHGLRARGKRKFKATPPLLPSPSSLLPLPLSPLLPPLSPILVIDALRMAWFRRRPTSGLIFHSDRGSQYASGDFQKQLSAFGMRGSMSRKGNCWDNAVTETLFGSMKVERLHGMRFASRRQAKDEVIDWLGFYNHRRLHSTLDYRSPMAFEKKWVADKERLAA